MRVLICGDRNWTDRASILARLKELQASYSDLLVIEGGARGADRIAADLCNSLGILCEEFPADWKKYRRAAGRIRNLQMLTEGKPDLVLAFHDNLLKSRGTRHMVDIATEARIPVEVIRVGATSGGGSGDSVCPNCGKSDCDGCSGGK